MCTEKVRLRNVKVEYVKGKYSYKQLLNNLSSDDSIEIKLSNSLRYLKDPDIIQPLYSSERNNVRLDKSSRDALKGLQMNLTNSRMIESKGVTHIIVYECLNK